MKNDATTIETRTETLRLLCSESPTFFTHSERKKISLLCDKNDKVMQKGRQTGSCEKNILNMKKDDDEKFPRSVFKKIP